MLKRILLMGALLAPMGAWAQTLPDLARIAAMVAMGASESPRGTEVNALYSLDWPPAISTQQARAEQLVSVLDQASRGVVELGRRIDAHPDSADLYQRRGFLYAQLDKVKRATADFEKACTLNVKAPDPKLDLYLAQGYLEADLLAEANNFAGAYTDRTPNDPRPYRLRALAEMRLSKGDHADHCRAALPDLNRAMKLDSADFTTRLLRGYALATINQFAPAIADYRRVLAVAPDNAQVHFFLAEALIGTGSITEACQHLSLAMPFAPDTVKWYVKKHCH